MINFNTYSDYDSILEMLCRLRVKLAHKRNADHLVHIHTKDPYYNYHNHKPSKTEAFLCSLFPPRKKWKQSGLKHRFKHDGASRNTAEKNMRSLLITVKYYEQHSHHPEAIFLTRLKNYITEIQEAIHLNNYKVGTPTIIPKLKNDEQSDTEINICRPIASFNLKDKIILSITNRFLTNILDELFHDESFAFRAKRKTNGILACPTHHDPVQEIISYREKFQEGQLWVSECDMKKFYDTVNHTVIKKVFTKLFKKKQLSKYDVDDIKKAKRILYDYLDSYTFNRKVLPLNKNQSYFKKYRIKNGKFGWVSEDLLNEKYYKRLNSAKIGIPQGGALSGLIANAVLNEIDSKILKNQDTSLLYLRFCDDMIIMHPNKNECTKAFNLYLQGLKEKKLVPHQAVLPPFKNLSAFWEEKSKDCYKWNLDDNSGSPWIGFVGYEIHYQGHVRVRKSSLKKEMKKQYKVVGNLKNILNTPHCRSSKHVIYESVVSRLMGMSVGRVTLHNYKNFKNEMCWVSGYKLLNDNKYSRIQLRRLDASRNKLLNKLKVKISLIDDKKDKTDDNDDIPVLQNKYHGKPFSYFYQTMGR